MADDRHVRRSGDDYAQALLSLLPQGPAWPRDPGSTLVRALTGLAEYWGYVDDRAADLLETESDPRATTELITDWERNWGLPDPCLKDPPTDLDSRRKALVEKMTFLGAQSRQFYIDLAAALGYTITITEYVPYMCGVSHVGDRSGIYNPDDPTRSYWQLGAPEIRYYWTVHLAAVRLHKFHVSSDQCGINRLLEIGIPEDIECLLNRYKPAHTHIIYDYSTLPPIDPTPPL